MYCRKILAINMAFGNFWTGYECCVTTRLFLPKNIQSNNVNHARGMLSPSAMQSTYLQLLTMSKSPLFTCFKCYFTTKGSIETIYIYIL